MSHRPVDVLIAGAGVAGVAAAAALGEFGWEVLLIDPGLDGTRRLAGELIHPPGTTDLAALGLLHRLEEKGGTPVHGFAVVPDAGGAAGAPTTHVLPYVPFAGQRPQGFAMEHSEISANLLRAVERLPHVVVWHGARLTALDAPRPDVVTATVKRRGVETKVAARLLVGADGGSSTVRRLLGIGHQRRRISKMLGYVLPGGELPAPGYGTVFLGGPAPALAYHIGGGNIRIMFDIPSDVAQTAGAPEPETLLAAL